MSEPWSYHDAGVVAAPSPLKHGRGVDRVEVCHISTATMSKSLPTVLRSEITSKTIFKVGSTNHTRVKNQGPVCVCPCRPAIRTRTLELDSLYPEVEAPSPRIFAILSLSDKKLSLARFQRIAGIASIASVNEKSVSAKSGVIRELLS